MIYFVGFIFALFILVLGVAVLIQFVKQLFGG